MRKIVLSLMFLVAGSALAEACCSYGCCDCGCVALKVAKQAKSIEKAMNSNLGSKGSIQSFSVTIADEPRRGKWSCKPKDDGAICTKK